MGIAKTKAEGYIVLPSSQITQGHHTRSKPRRSSLACLTRQSRNTGDVVAIVEGCGKSRWALLLLACRSRRVQAVRKTRLDGAGGAHADACSTRG